MSAGADIADIVAIDAVGYLSIAIGVLMLAAIVYLAWRYWPRRRPAAPEPEGPAYPEIDEPPADKHVRTPSDVLSLIIGVLLMLLGLLVATGASNTLVGFERDLINAFDALPEVVARILGVTFIVIAAVIPTGVGVAVLWRRRYRLLGMLAAAGLLGQLLLGVLDEAVVKRVGQPELLDAVKRPEWARDVGSIDSAWIAGMVAVVVLGSPWISRAWRRAGWITVIVAVVFRAVAGNDAPLDVVLAIGAGVTAGAAMLLAFGAPNKRPQGIGHRRSHAEGGRAAAQAGPRRRRRAQLDALLRRRRRRAGAVHQGARARRAERRPDVPPVPLSARQGRG